MPLRPLLCGLEILDQRRGVVGARLESIRDGSHFLIVTWSRLLPSHLVGPEALILAHSGALWVVVEGDWIVSFLVCLELVLVSAWPRDGQFLGHSLIIKVNIASLQWELASIDPCISSAIAVLAWPGHNFVCSDELWRIHYGPVEVFTAGSKRVSLTLVAKDAGLLVTFVFISNRLDEGLQVVPVRWGWL